MTSALTSASPRPAPDLRHAFGGVWRLTFPGFLGAGRLLRLLGLLAGLGFLTYAATRHGPAGDFFDWTTKFYLTFLVPVLAFVSGGGAIRDDLKPQVVDYVFTRPVPRPAFVVFRYLAHLAGMQLNCLLALAVLLGVGFFRQTPGLAAAVPLLLLAQVLTVSVFTAFGFLCGALTTRYLIVGMFYGAMIEVGVGNIPTQINRLSLLHHVQALVQPLTTDNLAALPGQNPVFTTGLLLATAATMLAVAAIVFGLRELAGGKPKES
jgi:ABC-type transport system involved in multi-copper enzyme maturation permease subunit